MSAERIQVFLIDDEPLAIERMKRLLGEFSELTIVGTATQPRLAIDELKQKKVDALFLDICMPGMNGFELLAKLPEQPSVIFTTAYDEYALRAFEVNSIDYLLKPVEQDALRRAIAKLSRLVSASKPQWQQSPQFNAILQQMSEFMVDVRSARPHRIARRVGDRISFLDIDQITHFIAHDKVTYAVIEGQRYAIDSTIQELENRLTSMRFFRIHRSVLINVDWIHEVNSSLGGTQIKLKDPEQTRLPVARDKARALKEHLGIL